MTPPTQQDKAQQDRDLLDHARKIAGDTWIHGMNGTREHDAWRAMKQRCFNEKHPSYPNYGGRGITVCDQWVVSFTAFLSHIGMRPSDGHSVDRIDVNGNYEPGNVRWATLQQQAENTRSSQKITIGSKALTRAAWEREMGLSKGLIKSREKSGWPLEKAILTPARKPVP